MKRRFFLVFGILLFLVLPPLVKAQENRSQRKMVTLPQGETVNKDYFAMGDVVEIAGTVNGDAYVLAGQLIVTGTINGDLLAAGGNVEVPGNITQNARLAGGQVTVNGNVGRNLSIAGGNINVNPDARLNGNFVAAGGSVSLNALVNRDVTAGVGSLTISNSVGGNVEAWVGSLRLSPQARVNGDLIYYSNQAASIDSSAIVSGKITQNIPQVKAPEKEDATKGLAAAFTFWKIISFVSTLIIGLLLIFLVPGYTDLVVQTLKERPWLSLGIGLLTLILVPIIIVLLLITVIGIPLALILLAIYLIMLFAAKIFTVLAVGSWILARTTQKFSQFWVLLLGLATYYLITLTPIFGGIISFLVLLFGLGADILAKRDTYVLGRKNKIV